MFEQSRTNFKVTSVKRATNVCMNTEKNSKVAKALEGAMTIDEYFNKLEEAYLEIHKNEAI